MTVLLIIGLIWILPIYLAHQIGRAKNRPGWAWGLLLGWLGVLCVALLPADTPRAQPGPKNVIDLPTPGPPDGIPMQRKGSDGQWRTFYAPRENGEEHN